MFMTSTHALIEPMPLIMYVYPEFQPLELPPIKKIAGPKSFFEIEQTKTTFPHTHTAE